MENVKIAKQALVQWSSLDGNERGFVYSQIAAFELSVAREKKQIEMELEAMNETIAAGNEMAFHETYDADMRDRLDRLGTLTNVLMLAKITLVAASELGNVFAKEEDDAKRVAELRAVAAEKLAVRDALRGKWGYYVGGGARGPFDSKDAAMLHAIESVGFSLVQDKLQDCPELLGFRFEVITVVDPERYAPDVDDVLDVIANRMENDDVQLEEEPEIHVSDKDAAADALALAMKTWCDDYVEVSDPEWYVSNSGAQIAEEDIARLAKSSQRQMDLPHTK